MDAHLLRLLIVLATTISRVHSVSCPWKCSCSDSEVTCSDLTSFPLSLPVETRLLNITNSMLEEIPANAFNDLPNLITFEITKSNIKKVSSHSFDYDNDNLNDVIMFSDVEIGEIEPFSFNSISVSKFSILGSTIGTIKSQAFHDCYEIEQFLIANTRIGLIEPAAFEDIWDFGRFEITSTTIGIIRSHAFSNFYYGELFSITGSTISILEQAAFDTFILGGRLNVSNNNINNLHPGFVSNIHDNDIPTIISITFNNIININSQTTDLQLSENVRESLKNMDIHSNTVPCTCEIEKVRTNDTTPFLKTNWCFDRESDHLYIMNEYLDKCDKEQGTEETKNISTVSNIAINMDRNIDEQTTPAMSVTTVPMVEILTGRTNTDIILDSSDRKDNTDGDINRQVTATIERAITQKERYNNIVNKREKIVGNSSSPKHNGSQRISNRRTENRNPAIRNMTGEATNSALRKNNTKTTGRSSTKQAVHRENVGDHNTIDNHSSNVYQKNHKQEESHTIDSSIENKVTKSILNSVLTKTSVTKLESVAAVKSACGHFKFNVMNVVAFLILCMLFSNS